MSVGEIKLDSYGSPYPIYGERPNNWSQVAYPRRGAQVGEAAVGAIFTEPSEEAGEDTLSPTSVALTPEFFLDGRPAFKPDSSYVRVGIDKIEPASTQPLPSIRESFTA